jgi:hypothetical protein
VHGELDGDRVLYPAWHPLIPVDWRHSTKENVLLTESTVESMFRKLMNDPQRDEDTFDKAEELLEEELRPESPLRHRLSVELEELRTLVIKS